MNPERCHCPVCSNVGWPKDICALTIAEYYRLQKAIAAAVEVAYDPGKQPALVLTLIELGFIPRTTDNFPILDE